MVLLFFQPFLFSNFFLDHPIAFGLLKDSTRQLSFSAFLFRKSAYHNNFLAWQQAWIISNKLHFTLPIFLYKSEFTIPWTIIMYINSHLSTAAPFLVDSPHVDSWLNMFKPPSFSVPDVVVVKRFNCSMMYSLHVDVSYFLCCSVLFLRETNERCVGNVPMQARCVLFLCNKLSKNKWWKGLGWKQLAVLSVQF